MLHIERALDEEFQEADILWPDDAAPGLQQLRPQVFYYSQQADPNDDDGDEHDDELSSDHYRATTKLQVGHRASSPIDIPGRKGTATGAKAQPAAALSSKLGGGSVVVGSHVFVPPHVIVDRRAKRDKAAMMMLVVPSGGGRARKIREHCYHD